MYVCVSTRSCQQFDISSNLFRKCSIGLKDVVNEDDGNKTTRLIIVVGEFRDQFFFFIYP